MSITRAAQSFNADQSHAHDNGAGEEGNSEGSFEMKAKELNVHCVCLFVHYFLCVLIGSCFGRPDRYDFKQGVLAAECARQYDT